LATRQQQKRPYSMVFCGVNGVGKSTNLAKIWCGLAQALGKPASALS